MDFQQILASLVAGLWLPSMVGRGLHQHPFRSRGPTGSQSKESANVMAHGGHERAVSTGLVSTIDADVSECFCRLVIIRLPRLRFPLRRAEVYLQFGLSADFSQFSGWALAA